MATSLIVSVLAEELEVALGPVAVGGGGGPRPRLLGGDVERLLADEQAADGPGELLRRGEGVLARLFGGVGGRAGKREMGCVKMRSLIWRFVQENFLL